jgi:hypothetical protein
MKFSFVFVICIVLLDASCGKKNKTPDPKFDDSLYEKLDETFYKNKSTGKFYIHTSMLTTVDDSAKKIVFYYKEVPTVDTGSFIRLDQGGYFAKDNKQVYTWDVMTDGIEISILKGADAASFKVIGYEWARDTNYVYHRGMIVKGLNPVNVQLVCADTEDSSTTYIRYIHDEDQLFYKDDEIKVPADVDLNKLSCVEDLFGNPFISFNNHLYVVRNGALVVQE